MIKYGASPARQCGDKSACMTSGAVKRVFAVGDWTMRYCPLAMKCKLDSPWLGPYLVVAITGGPLGFSYNRTHQY